MVIPNQLKKTVHILSILMYVLITLYVLLCVPIIFGFKPLVVLTGSMEPTLHTGGIVYYKKVNPSTLKVGDIITFKTGGDTVVSHRIEKINSNSFVTKGDANNSVDPNEVPFSNVMGKDTNFCIPIMGYYVRFINTHIYVVIPVIIILILEFLFSNKSFDINNNEERRELDYGTRTNTTKEE